MKYGMHRSLLGTGAALLLALGAAPALASDHRDGTAVTAAPETDINDLYTWMSSDQKITYMVMTVFPAAGPAAKFSDSAYYVFHINSRGKFIDPMATPTSLDIICKFDAQQRIECWGAGEYVAGNPSILTGLQSRGGKLRVYAGLRKDPFFFNLDGFNDFRSTIKTALRAGQLQDNDANGCPNIAMPNTLTTRLRERPSAPGSVPTDAFAKQNTLAIVVGIDTTLINPGGPIVSIWAGTHSL